MTDCGRASAGSGVPKGAAWALASARPCGRPARPQHGRATASGHAPRLIALCAVAAFAAAASAAWAAAPPSREPAARQDASVAEGVAFLVLPITSDEEGLGDKVGEMLRFKAKRLGAAVYDPKSIAEALGSAKVSADMAAERLADLARTKFQADIVVTGHVKGKEPYEVRLVAVTAADPKQLHTLDKTYACSRHQVIALEMAKAVYEILGLQQPEDPLRMLKADAEGQRRWRDGPNLVRNPGFEQADASGTNPANWQAVEAQMAWTPNPDGAGKVLKYDMNQETAESYGLDFYSDFIDIEPGATYRFSCRYKSLGPTPKIFLKGYAWFEPSSGYAGQWRETYRRQVHPSGPQGRWNSVTADFVPEALKAEQAPRRLKVDLYAYYPAGVILWDDIVLKQVRDAPHPAPEGKVEPAKEPPPAAASPKGPP